MKNNTRNRGLINSRGRRVLKRALALICAVVIFFTFTTLNIDVSALAHSHSGHVHTEDCYDATGALICHMPEGGIQIEGDDDVPLDVEHLVGFDGDLLDEYSAPERASRPDELSTMTAAVVQYIRSCCILCFCAFGAPGSARTRSLSLWVFQEGRRARAQEKSDAVRRLPAKPRTGAHVALQRCTILRCE